MGWRGTIEDIGEQTQKGNPGMERSGLKRSVIYFTVIVVFMAFMDGFNFYFPHNDGFWSLNYDGSNDIWHWLKRGLLFVVFMYMYGFKYKQVYWYLKLLGFALIALAGQVLIFDLFIKLF